MNAMAKVRESQGTDVAAVKSAIELCGKREAFYTKIDDLVARAEALQLDLITTMSQVRHNRSTDTAEDKKQLALYLKSAIELCEKRTALLKQPDVFGVRPQKWYHTSRQLDDFMGPPAKAFRDAAGVE
jgi:hypothetical protein